MVLVVIVLIAAVVVIVVVVVVVAVLDIVITIIIMIFSSFVVSLFQCSVYCGKGTKSRNIWCEARGKKVDEKHCGHLHKPKTTRLCNKRRRCGEWEFGVWSKVNGTIRF